MQSGDAGKSDTPHGSSRATPGGLTIRRDPVRRRRGQDNPQGSGFLRRGVRCSGLHRGKGGTDRVFSPRLHHPRRREPPRGREELPPFVRRVSAGVRGMGIGCKFNRFRIERNFLGYLTKILDISPSKHIMPWFKQIGPDSDRGNPKR